MSAPVRLELTPGEGVRWHDLANVFPWIEGDEREALKTDISTNGVREPVVFLDGAILDGRNRYMVARELGIPYPRREFGSLSSDGDDPRAYVVSANLSRRHLTTSQKASLAARIANVPHGGNRRGSGNQSANLRLEARGPTQVRVADAARMLGISDRAVDAARKVHAEGASELVAALDAGNVAVSTAADIATLPKTEQTEIVAKGEAEIIAAAKWIRSKKQAEKRALRTANLVDLSQHNAPLPQNRAYPIIYADPPWEYDFSPSNSRAVENHYPTMPIEEILVLPVGGLATPDAMLFLWAPPSFIKKGIAVLEAWGFELASSMVWDKERIGTGIYFRQQHEYLLLGKRGQPITPVPGTQPASVLRAPRTAHSAKPAEVYGLIDRMYPGLPKIELFSRSPQDGWAAWGNQIHAV